MRTSVRDHLQGRVVGVAGEPRVGVLHRKHKRGPHVVRMWALGGRVAKAHNTKSNIQARCTLHAHARNVLPLFAAREKHHLTNRMAKRTKHVWRCLALFGAVGLAC